MSSFRALCVEYRRMLSLARQFRAAIQSCGRSDDSEFEVNRELQENPLAMNLICAIRTEINVLHVKSSDWSVEQKSEFDVVLSYFLDIPSGCRMSSVELHRAVDCFIIVLESLL